MRQGVLIVRQGVVVWKQRGVRSAVCPSLTLPHVGDLGREASAEESERASVRRSEEAPFVVLEQVRIVCLVVHSVWVSVDVTQNEISSSVSRDEVLEVFLQLRRCAPRRFALWSRRRRGPCVSSRGIQDPGRRPADVDLSSQQSSRCSSASTHRPDPQQGEAVSHPCFEHYCGWP